MNKLLRAAVQVRSETFFEEITQQCSNIIIMCEKITVREVRAEHIHIRRSRQMAFPILMSAGKVVQYFCHLPLLWVHYNKKETLNSVFI